MKKVFLISVLLGVICCSASLFAERAGAVDFNKVKQFAAGTVTTTTGVSINTNYKQQDAEKAFKETLYTEQMYLKMHCLMLIDDKETYQADNTNETIYGILIAILNKCEKLSLDTPEMRYAQKAKSLFDTLANCTPENTPTPETFKKMKIIIPDSDFDKISDDLKSVIFMLNLY